MTSYEVDAQGVALLRLERPEARNAIDTQMLVEMLEHLAVARADEAVRVLVISSSDHMGLSAGADVKEQLDEEGKVRRMQLFADLYDAIVAFPKPTVAVCHGDVVGGGAEIAIACDMRVGGSNLRMRFPGAALGRAGRPGPPGHPLRPRRRQVPAAHLAHRRRRRGAAARPGKPRRPGRGDRGGGAGAGRPVAAHPPEAVARLKRMLHEWDDVEGRSRAEGEGQVEWQRSGPGGL